MKLRHPEKANNPVNPIVKKPRWIRSKIVDTHNLFKTKEIIKIIFILCAKKQTVLIFMNAGVKNMQLL